MLVFIGAFHALQDEEDIRWVAHGLAFSLLVQALVALKMRFLDGRWQVHGWFEHQNPMAMWAYLCALPVLSLALSPRSGRRDTAFYLVGFCAAGLLILLSVSRAALVAFAVGSVLVVGLAAARGWSAKVAGIAGAGALGALVVSLVALDSFMARVHEASSRQEEHDLRAILNAQSKAMLHDHPLGVGWNNFGVANSLPVEKYAGILMDWDQSRGFRLIDDNYLANPLTESLYWLLLAETGYGGFASFSLFLLVTFWWAARSTLAFWRTPTGYLAAGLLVALGLTYIHCSVRACAHTDQEPVHVADPGGIPGADGAQSPAGPGAGARGYRPFRSPGSPGDRHGSFSGMNHHPPTHPTAMAASTGRPVAAKPRRLRILPAGRGRKSQAVQRLAHRLEFRPGLGPGSGRASRFRVAQPGRHFGRRLRRHGVHGH